MNPREAVLLSPYRPPTSYPVSLNPEEASAWLNGYFALWHPSVLSLIGRPPQAAGTYDHDVPKEGGFYTVPTGPTVYQPENWTELVKRGGGLSFVSTPDVTETTQALNAALGEWGDRHPNARPAHLLDIPRETVELFEAVGFGFLLIESLFDAASHDHLLDVEGFWADVKAAVEVAGDVAAVREKLTPAVEKLANARQVLNSSGVQWVDFAIPNSDTLGEPWPGTLLSGQPSAVIASGELLEQLAKEHLERFAELKARAGGENPTVDLCVGAYVERDDSLLPPETQWWNLTEARRCVHELFGVESSVYARTRSAFHPHLPGWLLHTGFTHAVMVSFDGAMTPARNAVVVNWASPDGKTVNAFAREPLAASDPLTFFNLVYHLHQAFSSDSTPTVAFKHTGTPAAVGYSQLVTLGALGDGCGKWVSVAELLRDHHYGEYLGSPSADDYFNDYLDDRVTNGKHPYPVSQFATHLRLRRKLDSAFALAALHRVLTPPGEKDTALLNQLEAVEREVESNSDREGAGSPETGTKGERIAALEDSFARLLADRIQVKSPADQPGVLVFNPCNFTRRVALELPDFGGPIAAEGAVKAVEFANGLARLVVEVPSLGYTWIPRGSSSTLPPKPRIKTAENGIVRNEFLEADFDPATGSIRAVRDLRSRTNRMGMQLVFNPGSRTKPKAISVTNSGTAMGEVVCDGEIVDEHDNTLCKFRQRLRAWIGRPVLEVRIELDPVHRPTGYPWHAYYGARFAWRDSRAVVFRGNNGSNDRSTYTRPVSADYLELRIGAERTFVFTGGLPYIQKHGDRMADIILMPEGEQARSFDLIVAMDREYPMPTAAGWVAPSPVVFTGKGPPHIGSMAWLAHVDLPSALMTGLRPVVPGEGMNRAVAMRLMETAGFAGTTDIQFARDPNRVSPLSGDDRPGTDLEINGGAVTIDFSANETFRIKAEWQ